MVMIISYSTQLNSHNLPCLSIIILLLSHFCCFHTTVVFSLLPLSPSSLGLISLLFQKNISVLPAYHSNNFPLQSRLRNDFTSQNITKHDFNSSTRDNTIFSLCSFSQVWSLHLRLWPYLRCHCDIVVLDIFTSTCNLSKWLILTKPLHSYWVGYAQCKCF